MTTPKPTSFVDLLLGRKTRAFLIGTAMVATLAAPAQAADPYSSLRSKVVGDWCLVEASVDDPFAWSYFNRGKCRDEDGTDLILKPNGDYTLTGGDGNQTICKAAKYFYKGWQDYNCVATHDGGRPRKFKTNQKFLFDTESGQLMLSAEEIGRELDPKKR
jgi:hypothetical protein